jgi:hypothetical protein
MALGFDIAMLLASHMASSVSAAGKGVSVNKSATWAVVTLILLGAAWAQEQSKPPSPRKEHEWLKQLEGEWVTESEAVMGPGQAPLKCKWSEVVRSLGGFWTIGEMKSDIKGTLVTGIMTLGYNPQTKKYIGSWVCSMDGHLWKYEGTVDATGKVLTLNTEGPSMANPDKTVKMKDVIEIKDKDHKVLTSYMQGDDGKWVPFMTMNARRK